MQEHAGAPWQTQESFTLACFSQAIKACNVFINDSCLLFPISLLFFTDKDEAIITSRDCWSLLESLGFCPNCGDEDVFSGGGIYVWNSSGLPLLPRWISVCCRPEQHNKSLLAARSASVPFLACRRKQRFGIIQGIHRFVCLIPGCST